MAQPVEEVIPDYEVELTVVIGKAAKNVSEANALDYVLAYTAANDVRLVVGPCVTGSADCPCKTSFRYHQMAVSQWNFSKGYGMVSFNFCPCACSSPAILRQHDPDRPRPRRRSRLPRPPKGPSEDDRQRQGPSGRHHRVRSFHDLRVDTHNNYALPTHIMNHHNAETKSSTFARRSRSFRRALLSSLAQSS